MRKAISADERSVWAEDLQDFGPDAEIYEGEESRAALSDLLDGRPAAGEEEVTRRLRGRPSLSGTAARGRASRQLHVRVSDHFDALIRQHVEKSGLRGESELVRIALAEYFDNHKIGASSPASSGRDGGGDDIHRNR